MPDAARQTDQISHTSAVTGLLAGLAVGALVAVAVAATVATGGVAGVLIGAGIGLAGTAGGGLAGEYIGAAIPSAATGTIATGSPNVFICGQSAARAVVDSSACSGLPLIPHGLSPIAQGSTTVFINGMMAARVGDMLVCSARISTGCATVIIGGATGTTAGIDIQPEIPSAVNNFLTGAMWAGIGFTTLGTDLALIPTLGILGGGAVALANLAGGTLGGAVGGWVGGETGGAVGSLFGAPELGRRIGEVSGGIAGSVLGGGIAGRAVGKYWPKPSLPEEPPPPRQLPPDEPPPRQTQKPDPSASKPYRDNPGQFEGKPPAEVEKELDKTLVEDGHWTKSPTKDGNGVRYLDNKGGSVIINKGYPEGLQGGGGDAVHQGSYVKIQPGGIRVPLAGNPASGVKS